MNGLKKFPGIPTSPHWNVTDPHVLILAKGTGSSADSFGNDRKPTNYFEIGCSFRGWSSPYDCSCRGKASCQKQYLCYHPLTTLSSAFSRSQEELPLFTGEYRHCYWMCVVESAYFFSIGPYQIFFFFKGTSLTIMFQVMYRNAMK